MPQLDSVTFLSQVFWVFLGFFTYYLLLTRTYLPALHRLTRARASLQVSPDSSPEMSLDEQDEGILASASELCSDIVAEARSIRQIEDDLDRKLDRLRTLPEQFAQKRSVTKSLSLLLQDSLDAGFTTKKLSNPSAHTFYSLLKKASPSFTSKLVNDMADLSPLGDTHLAGPVKSGDQGVYTSLSAARSLSLLQSS
uniref:ATP synthase F0 subunit 8 n=1 Tax=Prasinococcus sp. CCMP1194 TaxID=110672 RepID=A0A650AKL4_9VIRI|nr:ATP synthase F0 subunit 8 [Prasinococcus sp. CCMP1194]